MARAVELLGGLDGVVVTTGLIGHEPIEISDERWIEVFRDVLLGTTRTVEAALPHLIASRGAIVTTAAYSIRAPEIARLPYASMKSAVATFTKGIAKTYGKQGVRANCVAPGAIETDALTAIRRQVSDAKGIPYDEALERVMVEEWHLDIALAAPGQAERGRRPDGVPDVTRRRLPHRRPDQHRRRHQLLNGTSDPASVQVIVQVTAPSASGGGDRDGHGCQERHAADRLEIHDRAEQLVRARTPAVRCVDGPRSAEAVRHRGDTAAQRLVGGHGRVDRSVPRC